MLDSEERKSRQAQGIRKAKSKGAYKGGKPVYNPKRIQALRQQGKTAAEITRELNCSRKTVYRLSPGMWGESPIRKRADG